MFDDDGELPKKIVDAANAAIRYISTLTRWDFIRYYAAKTAIWAAGTAFLSAMRMPLASAMFTHGMYGGGKNLSSGTKNLMISLLKKDSKMISTINYYIDRSNGKSFNSGKNFIEFKSGDIYYAIQHANIWISGTKQKNGSWLISVTLKDTYDFTEFRKGLGFSDIVNNLGWAMQTNGMMTPYDWSVSYTYTYWRR